MRPYSRDERCTQIHMHRYTAWLYTLAPRAPTQMHTMGEHTQHTGRHRHT